MIKISLFTQLCSIKKCWYVNVYCGVITLIRNCYWCLIICCGNLCIWNATVFSHIFIIIYFQLCYVLYYSICIQNSKYTIIPPIPLHVNYLYLQLINNCINWITISCYCELTNTLWLKLKLTKEPALYSLPNTFFLSLCSLLTLITTQ